MTRHAGGATLLHCSADPRLAPRLEGSERVGTRGFRGLLPRGMETFTFGRERLVREGE